MRGKWFQLIKNFLLLKRLLIPIMQKIGKKINGKKQ